MYGDIPSYAIALSILAIAFLMLCFFIASKVSQKEERRKAFHKVGVYLGVLDVIYLAVWIVST